MSLAKEITFFWKYSNRANLYELRNNEPFAGEDEKSCECSSDEVKCSYGGGCVTKSKLCDGHFDCADGSDEFNCLQIENERLRIRSGFVE
jgi:hypothetical protein